MTWDPLQFPIDYYTIGGQNSPAISQLQPGAAMLRKWDKKAGPGSSGAASVYHGGDLCSFAFKTLLWESEHFEQWATFQALLAREPTGVAKAFDVWHPALDDLQIRTVVVTEIGALTEEDDTGLYSVTVKYDQYQAPKPAKARVKGSKAEDKAEEEEDPIDKLIREKTAQYKDLSDQ